MNKKKLISAIRKAIREKDVTLACKLVPERTFSAKYNWVIEKIEGEINWCKQTHNKIKYVEYVGEQCKIEEVKKALREIKIKEDLMQDGIKVFIGNCELPFIKSGLEKAIQKPTWTANIGEIEALNKLSMALKTK